MFLRRAVGSVVGIGGMAGAMGGATLATLTGYILDRTGGNYMILFGIAASAYLVALTLIQLLTPNLEPAEDLDQQAGPCPSALCSGSASSAYFRHVLRVGLRTDRPSIGPRPPDLPAGRRHRRHRRRDRGGNLLSNKGMVKASRG